MTETYSVPLSSLVRDLHLQVAYSSTDFDSIRVTVEDVARSPATLTILIPCGFRFWEMWR